MKSQTMHMPKNRWYAFLIHFGLSSIVFFVLLYLIVFIWYPQPYFAGDGGWQGIQLITGVDLVLGPTLTLLVYKPGKRWLKVDLAAIALVQFVALAWGTWLVFEQRTLMVTYANGTFYTYNHVMVEGGGKKAQEILAASSQRPAYAIIRLPDNPEERRKFIAGNFRAGKLTIHLTDRYEPLGPEHLPELRANSVSMQLYADNSKEGRREVDAFLTRHKRSLDDFIFLPLVARYKSNSLFLALQRSDGKIVGSLDIARRPSWQLRRSTTPQPS